MSSLRKAPTHWRLLVASLLALALAWWPVTGGRLAADDEGDLVRVEEDWELIVLEPHKDTASPQVSTQMARRADAPRFCNFHLNSCDIPTFTQGGLQLQVWKDATNLAAVTSASRATLNTKDETITWTQYIRRANGKLYFGVSRASSTTWGDFSGVESEIPGTSTYLDAYSSDYSVQNSGVTFGANRVRTLTLVAVRKYNSSGVVSNDTTRRVVHETTVLPETITGVAGAPPEGS